MGRRSSITVFLVAAFLGSAAFARDPATTGNPVADSLVLQGEKLVDSGYSMWKKGDMLHGYALLQRADVLAPGDRYVEYYLAYAAYRLMTYGMATKQDEVYDEFADRAEKTAERLDVRYPEWSEPGVLLAAVYGIEIAHSWIKAPTLGPKSSAIVEKALSVDSTNPRACMILGTGKFNTPGIFGGSVGKAVEYFRKSVALFESSGIRQGQDLEPSWGYVDALTWLGLAYEKQERYADALAAYRRALEADPNYARAKHVLIPEVESKIGSSNQK